MIPGIRSVSMFAFVSIGCALLVPTGAADWSRWLGPDQTGASPERDVFGDAEVKLNLAWKRPLGVAYSGIAVSDGRAVTMFGDGETDWLTAMDAQTGEELWRYKVDKTFPVIGGADGGQLSMPVIDRGTVYGLGARGQLFAVRLRDGSKIWSQRVDEKFGARQPHFGFTTTPLVAGKQLFVQIGGARGKSLAAFDRKTGRLIWSVGEEAVGYQSPVLAELGGKKQIVAVTNASVTGLSLRDGRVLWRAEHALASSDGFSTAVMLGDGAFLLTGRHESAAYRVERTDEGWAARELWRGENLKRNFAMPVVYDGHVFGYDAEFLACVDASTGERVWKHRLSGVGLVLVDGHLVIYASDGSVVVARASSAGFEEAARVEIADPAGLTFPSFADGAIYVRDLERIARVDVVR